MLISWNQARETLRLDGRSAAAFLCTVMAAGSARAAGVEDTVGGAIGLGRSAYFARVNDFMATWQNPANLAIVPGGDMGAELRFPLLQACFDRARDKTIADAGGYQEEVEGGDGFESFANVCNKNGLALTANIGWAQSFESGFGWGIGLFTPAAVGSSKYGNDTILSVFPGDNQAYEPTFDGVEAPNRHLGIERDAVTAYVMAGLGYQPIKQLRIGASAGIGFASIYNKSVVSTQGGTFADQEVINELRVSDYAIPRATAGLVFTPLDALELFGTITYQGDINGTGSAELTANGIQGEPLANCRWDDPGTHCRIDGVKLTVPFQTYEATFGFRVVHRRVGRERVLDPMHDELWDFEVDASWAQTSHVDAFRVKLHNDVKPMEDGAPDNVPEIQFSSDPDQESKSLIRQSTKIPKNWKDTWTVRAGGDVNVIRDRLSLRAGVSYATAAVPNEFMNIDYWPVRKIGLHLGATIGFMDRFKITAGYAHIFFDKVTVPLGTGGIKDIATVAENVSQPVNEGTYVAGLDVVSVQLNAKF
jgi:hypothetical protein